MIINIQPSVISGNIWVTRSKSSMQRACAAALLTNGITEIIDPGCSNDDNVALELIQKLGAKIEITNNKIIVVSNGIKPITNKLNCGESGLSIRMFTTIASLSKQALIITGEGSLVSRPMEIFNHIFPLLHVKIESNHGKLPFKIQGPLMPKNIEIDGSLSSQFLTGLLMAYSVAGADKVGIKVNGLQSKPYIDLTLKVMKDFEMYVPENNNYELFYYHSNKTPSQHSKKIIYNVEGDWSGSAFLLVAGAIAGNITLNGLDTSSTQADKAILEAIKATGAFLSIRQTEITISSTETLKPFYFDAADCPDLFPPLAVLAAHCNGQTIIKGVNRLTYKESNRGITLQQELGKMGVQITLQDNSMIIEGGKALTGANIDSHNDHRIAMACAIAALKAKGTTTIDHAEAVNKSYPDFYHHLKYLGANILLL